MEEERRGDRNAGNEKEGKKTTFQVILSERENDTCRMARHTKGREGEGERGRGREAERERERKRGMEEGRERGG